MAQIKYFILENNSDIIKYLILVILNLQGIV